MRLEIIASGFALGFIGVAVLLALHARTNEFQPRTISATPSECVKSKSFITCSGFDLTSAPVHARARIGAVVGSDKNAHIEMSRDGGKSFTAMPVAVDVETPELATAAIPDELNANLSKLVFRFSAVDGSLSENSVALVVDEPLRVNVGRVSESQQNLGPNDPGTLAFTLRTNGGTVAHTRNGTPTQPGALQVSVKDPNGQRIHPRTTITFAGSDANGDDRWAISIAPPTSYAVGKYHAEFSIADAYGNTAVTKQDFPWGVLAINTDKSSYKPGETVKFSIAVLDENGKMDCDALVKLEISGGVRAVLSTRDKTINVTPACHEYKKTNQPDFVANWRVPSSVGTEGTFALTLSAKSNAGDYAISSAFRVDKSPGLVVTREAPSRLYPPATYPMKISFSSQATRSGIVQETVPSEFTISKQANIVEAGTKRVVGTPLPAIEKDGHRILRWSVSVRGGHEYSTSYEFKPVDRSPAFWLIGPLQLRTKQGVLQADEGRTWQLAGDAVTSWVLHRAAETVDSVPAVTNGANMSVTAGEAPAATFQVPFGTTTGYYQFTPGVDNSTTGTPGSTPTGKGWWTTNPYVGSSASANWTFDLHAQDNRNAAVCKLRVIAYTNTKRSTTGATQLFDTGDLGTDICTNANTTYSQTYNPGAINLSTISPSGPAKYLLFEYWVNVTTAGVAASQITFRHDQTQGTVVTPEATNTFATAVNITGNVYSDEGVTPLGTTPTVSVYKDGTCSSCTTTVASNAYILSVDSLSSGNTLTAYLSSGSDKANVVAEYSPANTASDGKNMVLDLYKDRIVARGTTGAADFIDRDSDDDSTYLLFKAESSSFTCNGVSLAAGLCISNGTELHIATGSTATLPFLSTNGQVHVQGTLQGSLGGTQTFWGSGTGTSRPLYVDGGTYSALVTPAVFMSSSTTDVDLNNSYYSLSLYGSTTFRLGTTTGQTLTSTGAINIGDGTSTTIVDASVQNPNISTTNVSLVNANATFVAGSGTYTFPRLVVTGTYTGSTETLTLTSYGAGSGQPLYITGTFTPSSNTVKYTNTTGNVSEISSSTLSNLTIQGGSTSATYRFPSSSILNGTLTVTSGAIDMSTNSTSLTLKGSLALSGASGTTSWSQSSNALTWSPTGSQTWSDTTDASYDPGTINISGGTSTPKVTLAGNAKITKLSVASSHTLDMGTGGYSLTLKGSGTGSSRPIVNNGTFTASSSGSGSTVIYTGTSTTEVSPLNFNGLTLAPSSGTPTYRMGTASSQTIGVSGALTTTGSPTVDWSTYNAALTLNGNLTISSGTTWTKGTATFTWSPTSGSSNTYTGPTTSPDFGAMAVTGGSGGKTVAINNAISVTTLSVASGHSIAANGFIGWAITGSGTGGSRPLQCSGSCATILSYTGTSTTEIDATTYLWLSLAPSSGSPTYRLGSASSQSITTAVLITTGTVTVDAATYNPTMNMTTSQILSLSSGTVWQKGASGINFVGNSTGTWADASSPTQDLGPVTINTSGSVTLAGNAGATSVTITSGTFSTASSGYTLTLYGSGIGTSRPLYVNGGTFTGSGSSTVVFKGTSATDIQSTTYNNLTLSPPSGTPTYTLPASLTVAGGFSTSGTFTVKADSNNTNMTVNGTFSLGSGTTWTKGSGTLTFSPTGSKGWSDANTTKQDMGAVAISGGASTPTILLGSGVRATSVSIASSHTLNLNGLGYDLNLTGSSNPLVINGTFTAPMGGFGSSTTYSGSSSFTIPNATYSTLVISPASGTPTHTFSGLYTVAGGFAGVNASIDFTANPTFTLNGSLLLISTTWAKGSSAWTWSPTGSALWNAQSGSESQDVGPIAITGGSSTPTVTLTTNVTAESVSIAASHTLDLGSSNYTLSLTGNGTPLSNSGTFTAGTSTVAFKGTGATTIPALTYSGLSLAPASGSPTYTTASGTITVGGSLNVTGTPTIAWNTNNTALNLSGNLSVANGATWTKGNGTLTWSPTGTKTWTDANTTKQDFGAVALSGGSSTPTISLSSGVKMTSLSVASSHTFNRNGNGLTITGSGTGGSRPLANSGTVTGSGTTTYTSTSTTDIESGSIYAGLSLAPASGTPTFSLRGSTTASGDLSIASAATLDTVSGQNYALSVGGDWSNAGTFTPQNGTVTLSGSNTVAVTGATTFYDLTISAPSGRTMTFSNSGSDIITIDHTFSAAGASGTPLVLGSTSPANKWHIKPLGTGSVSYVSVSDGGCESGSVVMSQSNSTDGGNNDYCWGFNAAPDTPTSLAQKTTGDVAITTGEWVSDTDVKFTASATDADPSDTLHLCVEKQPIGTPFTDAEDGCGTGVAYSGSPVTATVTISGMAEDAYHWQARLKDNAGTYSSWVSFGGNAESARDFGLDITAPIAGGLVYDGSTPAVDVNYNDGALDVLDANWDAFTDANAGIDAYEYSIGTTIGGTDVRNWTSNASWVTVNATSLNLATSERYFFNVRATDHAGNTSTVSSSDGQLVAPTLVFSVNSTLTPGVVGASNLYTTTGTVDFDTSTNAANGYSIYGYAPSDPTNGSATVDGFDGGSYASPDTWQLGDTGYGYTSNDALIGGVNKFQDDPCPGGAALAAPGCYAPFATSGPGDVVADHPAPISGTAILNEQFQLALRITADASQVAGIYNFTLLFTNVANY